MHEDEVVSDGGGREEFEKRIGLGGGRDAQLVEETERFVEDEVAILRIGFRVTQRGGAERGLKEMVDPDGGVIARLEHRFRFEQIRKVRMEGNQGVAEPVVLDGRNLLIVVAREKTK